jgi:hypothetical protein
MANELATLDESAFGGTTAKRDGAGTKVLTYL